MASTAFDIVKYRMEAIGIEMDDFVASELNNWSNGFNFIPKKDWTEFAWALRSSGRFCIDTGLGARMQKGALSWREIGSGDKSGMHVLFRKGKPWKGYPTNISYFEVHVDSISPTSEQVAGTCSYINPANLDNLWNHAAVDLLHLPFILPDKEGLKLGFRF